MIYIPLLKCIAVFLTGYRRRVDFEPAGFILVQLPRRA
jgi:hypothetical protein